MSKIYQSYKAMDMIPVSSVLKYGSGTSQRANSAVKLISPDSAARIIPPPDVKYTPDETGEQNLPAGDHAIELKLSSSSHMTPKSLREGFIAVAESTQSTTNVI